MKKMTTNQQKTLNVLDGKFVCSEGNKINKEYFEHTITLVLDNTENLINAVTSNRRKRIHSIVFEALMIEVNACLNDEYCNPSVEYYATTNQIKKWLKLHNEDFEIFKDLIKSYEDERNAALEEK